MHRAGTLPDAPEAPAGVAVGALPAALADAGEAAGTAAALVPSDATGRGPPRSQPELSATSGDTSSCSRISQCEPNPSTPAPFTASARSTFLERTLAKVCGLAQPSPNGMLRMMLRFIVLAGCALAALACGGQA